ncbi:uncharacterized protein Z518_08988 [Rhinocladiella mackenziei CBS 650.93]|uniref:Transcription factor domain-containing protein n=1 Tax=Rhinocladiella mackenziei CBS 650.93 TaxID=1442369 RepID=A0A0D2GSD9_9EURO|nr:uncharacterized protein Z518_08988 [Rhinocladiella mackenziei CBS 650.93]KIX01263.1 hypothetical protein Z518_08988 [Rhinocladiella mackenziei CBS 650.93]
MLEENPRHSRIHSTSRRNQKSLTPIAGSAARIHSTPQALSSSFRRKRLKIQLACSNKACQKRGVLATCIYKRPHSDLQRDGDREELLTRQGYNEGLTRSVTARECRLPGQGLSPPASSTIFQNAPSSTFTESHGQHSEDGLATTSSPDDTDTLYGGSSTIAFVRHVSHGLQDQPTSTGISNHVQLGQSGSGHAPTRHLTNSSEVVRDKDDSAAVYPRRRSADDFLSCYWQFIHPLFPVLHKCSFIAKYREIWHPEDRRTAMNDPCEVENTIFVSTLNLVFALEKPCMAHAILT